MFELESYFLPLAAFVLATAGTPGPNNMMLTVSGANFGFRRTVPHIAGIIVGVASLLLAVALGLGALFETFPALHTALKVAGALYLGYLAWKIATAAGGPTAGSRQGRPLTLWQAALFQYVNPKAWVMVITAVATFTYPGEWFWWSAGWVIVTYIVLMLLTQSCWAAFGMAIGLWLQDEVRRRRFNGVMGALTAASVVFLIS